MLCCAMFFEGFILHSLLFACRVMFIFNIHPTIGSICLGPPRKKNNKLPSKVEGHSWGTYAGQTERKRDHTFGDQFSSYQQHVFFASLCFHFTVKKRLPKKSYRKMKKKHLPPPQGFSYSTYAMKATLCNASLVPGLCRRGCPKHLRPRGLVVGYDVSLFLHWFFCFVILFSFSF